MMVIGVCGYGYSGSGAVLDFLREWNTCSCNLVTKEFDFLYLPHGIQDLEYQLLISVCLLRGSLEPNAKL